MRLNNLRLVCHRMTLILNIKVKLWYKQLDAHVSLPERGPHPRPLECVNAQKLTHHK